MIQFIPISSYLIGLSASGFISYRLGKLDPAGKFMIQFLSDYLKYRFRSKVHDGFERRRRTKNHPQPVYFNLDFTLIEGNRIGSFPAEGHVQFIELKTEASISVDKYGLVTINDKGDLLPPGSYDIKDGGITEKSVPPKIMPIPSSLPRK
ncbi:hypothetical protein HMPREF9413_1424 [Paenibacillus sp. HGF7]|nr:hypothetical protein HMPREF9413_1424 [Paenibacillus sp. HGF7]